ncbi:MAG TPA: glycosyltransferase family 4 protein [Candidatus Acidoferrales bacterium]|nr:glycosyltransferase family 4 protein [Candidatus Acidoferrales bacterium]
MTQRKPRIAVVSPFLDKQHGTERPVVEWLDRAADSFEIHIYSQQIEDFDLSKVVWHRIPTLRGPHLLNYLWWFFSNHLWRAWDKRFRGLKPELVYSPGVNCFDADLISVHIMFFELLRRNLPSMRLASHPMREWPRLMHRHLYYRLILSLERRIYRNSAVNILVISRRLSKGLQEFYGRENLSDVVYFGLDRETFNPQRRVGLREEARRNLGLRTDEFVLLLIGNDWLNKGLPLLLEVIDRLRELPLHLLVVGTDDPSPFQEMIRERALADRIHFLPPRKDVEYYYAAADVYTGPSKEDALPLPPAEAMACGLPVIVTAQCGVSEVMVDSENGMIMQDPLDAADLASKIRRLYEDKPFRCRLSENAVETAQQYNWDRSSHEFVDLLHQALRKKNAEADMRIPQED